MAARKLRLIGPAGILTLFTLLAVAASCQATGFGLDAGAVRADTDISLGLEAPTATSAAGSLDVAPAARVLDVFTLPSLTTDLLDRVAGPHTMAGSLLAGDSASSSHSESAGTAASSPSAVAVQATPEGVAAVGALAAAGTMALKLEPVRRGAFLLAVPLYSRLRRSQLLENGVRERIYRSIESNPGLSIIQVCRQAKVGWGTAVYHLQRLERDRMIASRRDGQYRRFFLNGHAPDVGAVDPAQRALAHPLANKIAAFIVQNPQAAQKDVCTALGIAPPLASKWLGRLLEAGLLTSQREWKMVRYAPTPALQTAMGPTLTA